MVAGEASADIAGAGLLRELKRLHPGLECYGVGSKHLSDQGMKVVIPSASLSVVGFFDWLDKAKGVISAYRKVVKLAEQKRPDVAVLLDLPDFNLRLAKKLKSLNIPVVYYISPQVWAWRKNRVKKIKELVDKMLVVFPFEKSFYEKEGLAVEFVGHPLLEVLEPRKRYRDQAVIQKTPRVAILPGSRKSELRYHAPILRELIQKIKTAYPGSEIKVPLASTLSKEAITKALKIAPAQVTGKSWDTLDWADIAVVASGTATLETALIGTPFCLFYKVNSSSAWLFKNWIKYRGFLGMPNILLGRQVVKECFQESATSEKLFSEIKHLVNSGPARLNMVSSLLSCHQLLGGKGASTRAAKIVSEVIKNNQLRHTSKDYAPDHP